MRFEKVWKPVRNFSQVPYTIVVLKLETILFFTEGQLPIEISLKVSYNIVVPTIASNENIVFFGEG